MMTGAKTFTVGSATVTKVVDVVLDSFTPASLLPDIGSSRLVGEYGLEDGLTADGNHVLLSVHTWVARHEGKTILVDTGVGNDKPRPHARYFHHLTTPYLDRLAAIGVQPDDVDYVLLTHLHVDHVGWNTRLIDGSWEPTFRNARYIFARGEFEFFADPRNLNDRNRTSFQVQEDSVRPVIEAGLADMVAVEGQTVIPGFSVHPTPGHSTNHASFILDSQGQQAIFAGDVVHHPLQVFRPEMLSVFDPVAEPTLASRLWALGQAADHQALYFSSHFPASSAGWVRRDGAGFAWSFA